MNSLAIAALPRIVRLIVWLWRIRLNRADLYIGGRENPYLLRWHLVRKDRWPVNVYLHRMLRDDDDRALHDHPWWFVSIILWGGYIEIAPRDMRTWVLVRRRGQRFVLDTVTRVNWMWPQLVLDTVTRECGPGRILFRRAEDAHRLMLRRPAHLGGESWSLVITGRPTRPWGFYCPQGWRDAREFANFTGDESTIGKGCA